MTSSKNCAFPAIDFLSVASYDPAHPATLVTHFNSEYFHITTFYSEPISAFLFKSSTRGKYFYFFLSKLETLLQLLLFFWEEGNLREGCPRRNRISYTSDILFRNLFNNVCHCFSYNCFWKQICPVRFSGDIYYIIAQNFQKDVSRWDNTWKTVVVVQKYLVTVDNRKYWCFQKSNSFFSPKRSTSRPVYGALYDVMCSVASFLGVK